jgi:hypothetical protein
MALWGNKDTVYSTGNITTITTAGVVTGSGTTFTDSGLVVSGQVITMGAYGSGVIKSVDSNTQLTLDSAAGLTAGSGLTQAFNIDESPKYLAKDSNYEGNEIYGVDTTEVGVAATTAYAVTHGGWVAIGATYVDSNGRTRYKHEVLVATGSITSDADDDTVLPDS